MPYRCARFAFADEIKAMLAHPAIPASAKGGSLNQYLSFGYASGEETLFQNIRKLMPGYWLSWSGNGSSPRIKVSSYWDVPDADPLEDRLETDWVSTVRQGLEETIHLRRMADVLLGSFLSGGIYSSAITAIMQRMLPSRVRTFSVGYSQQEFSELSYASDLVKLNG